MNAPPKVESKIRGGPNHRFGTGLFYKNDGPKKTIKKKSVLIVLSVSAVGVFIITIMFERGSRGSHANAELPETTINPSFSSSEPQKDLTSFEPHSPATTSKAKSKTNSKTSAIKFPGVALIERKVSLSVPPGTVVKAVLLSAATDGPVKARFNQAVRFDGGEVFSDEVILLRLGSSRDDRMHVNFTQMVSKSGEVFEINADACNQDDESVGLRSSRLLADSVKLATRASAYFLSGVAEGLQETEVTGGVAYKKPSVKNSLLEGGKKASMEYANDSVRQYEQKQEKIVIPKDTQICVSFHRR